jgi:hypothetical protein
MTLALAGDCGSAAADAADDSMSSRVEIHQRRLRVRAPVVGVYRFWRDSGYVFGGVLAGGAADALGYGGAIAILAALTAVSGIWVPRDMPARRHDPDEAHARTGAMRLDAAHARRRPAA